MVPRSAEIRERARESLRGNWGQAAGTFFLYVLVCLVFGLIYRIPGIGWVAELVLTGPLALGLYVFFLETARRENPAASTIFSGFKRFLDAFLLHVLMSILILLWTLLLIVPGIIAYFRYSQAYYILQDNPSIGPLEAIRQSKRMMIGHKGRLFVLHLTFIGWYILGAIPFGIGLLWVVPYFLTAGAHFYDDLRARSADISPPPAPPAPTF